MRAITLGFFSRNASHYSSGIEDRPTEAFLLMQSGWFDRALSLGVSGSRWVRKSKEPHLP